MKRSRIGPASYEAALALQQRKREKVSQKPRKSIARKQGLSQRRGKPLKRKRISKEEREWRETVLERDGYRCRWVDPKTDQRCGECGPHIQAHHINERSQRPDLALNADNGAAICPFHHDRLHHDLQGRKEARAQGLLSTAPKYEYRDRK